MNATHALVLPALVALAAGSQAQTQTDCHQNAIPMQLTNFTRTASLPRFDPALGHLMSVELRVVANIRGTSRIESLDAAPSVVNTHFAVDIDVWQADVPLYMVMLPVADFSDSLLAYDGVSDFGGTSGITHDNIQASDEFHAFVDPTPENLAMFTGSGMIDFMADAAGNSTAEGAGNLMTQFETSAGVDISVCYTFVGNTPPTVDCPGPLMASVGVPVQFQVCATDPDATDVVTLDGVLPTGAVANPPLPVMGNPACTTITWTPQADQVGQTPFVFTANDIAGTTATCTTTVTTAECHMVFGVGSGSSSTTIFGHMYDTQLARVRVSFPVTLIDNPSFPLRSLPPAMTMQVLMYNPSLFPTNPSQWSRALTIVRSGDTITSTYSGTENGLEVHAEVFQDVGQSTRVRFPFTILGL